MCGITGVAGVDFRDGFKSKSDALVFSIIQSTKYADGESVVNYEQAEELYIFILERIDLPELPKNPLEDTYAPLIKMIQEKLDKLGD